MASIQRLRAKSMPNCNRSFIFKAIREDIRIDGRSSRDFRDLSMGFGLEYGSCIVSLGASKVMCNINYEIVEPKPAKPCEGLLNIRLDLSAMMVYHREHIVEMLRVIEKNIKDSKCLDLESLCIIAGEKVFQLDADLIAINEDGNLSECCSIALLASLSHYRRPDVSVVDGEAKIHTFDERHPLPLHLLHCPFCTVFTFFESSKFVCDPLQAEEQVCDGYLIVGANLYREITTIHISGKSMIDKEIVLRCCNIAIERSKFLANFVKNAVQEDFKKRASGDAEIGFVPLIREDSFLLCGYRKEAVKLAEIQEPEEKPMEEQFDFAEKTKLYRFAPDTVGIGEGGRSQWTFDPDFEVIDDDADMDDGEIKEDEDQDGELKGIKQDEEIKEIKQELKKEPIHQPKVEAVISKPSPEEILVEDSDGSEEDVQILEPLKFK